MSQGWSKIFNRINWLNRPSTNTPLNATNLNAGDSAIDKLDDRIITLDTVKADMQVVNGMVADISVNDANGVITVKYKNGSTKTYDTNLEKIATNFTYDYSTQRLVLTLSDGSTQYVDMSALITQYEFKDSTTIAFSVDSTGKVSASVKNGSITEAMLETGYLANIKVEVSKAEAAASQAQSSEASSDYNAKLSRSYAIGGSGIREGEDKDNAMYYYEQAKKTDIGQISSEFGELNSNLDGLKYSEVAGGKNLWNIGDIKVSGHATTETLISGIFKSNTQYTIELKTKSFTTSDMGYFEFVYTDGTKSIISWDKSIGGIYATTSIYAKTIDLIRWVGWNPGENAEFTEIQLEEGTTATPYEPYIPSVKMLAEEVNQQKNDLVPKKIELQNVDERVTIQDNGSFIINGFAFVNLLVTFNETLPQWSNFVRLPRPKGGIISVHCENSVILSIYNQDNLPGDCGTHENVASGTEIRLLVNYEVA